MVPLRILTVGPYPPARDGIASYVVQEVAALRHEGHEVEVLSPWPSAAHHHLDLTGPRGLLAMARLARRFERLIVHHHPDVFYPSPASPAVRSRQGLALSLALRSGPPVELRLHEAQYPWGCGWTPSALATRLFWRSADQVSVHTARERDDVHRAYGVPLDRIAVVSHGAHFTPRTAEDQTSARRRLGLETDRPVLLSIGFIHPHKGFDRAVAAFAAADLASGGAQLHLVGSARTDSQEVAQHAEQLRSQVAGAAGVDLHEGYLSDEAFDRWLVAADAVVLPYRQTWSSGVLERALLYRRPVIAAGVGGLPTQADSALVVLVDDDEALAKAMAEAVGDRVSFTPVDAWPTTQEEVQAEVRARAARHRTGARQAGPTTGAAGEASAPVRRLPPLELPGVASSRAGGSLAKRAVRRLTAWQLDAVVGQVNRLQAATVEALEHVEARLRSQDHGDDVDT